MFIIFLYCFNATESQVELFILKLNVAHYKQQQQELSKDFYGPLVPCHYPEEEKLFRPSDYVWM